MRYVNMLTDVIEQKIKEKEGGEFTETDINLEFFPNKTRIKQGKLGQVIKLPFGRHVRTNEFSFFLEENGMQVQEMGRFLDNLSQNSLSAVKKILAVNTGLKERDEKKKWIWIFRRLVNCR